jgi:tRNA-dihydrouridine synthase 2
VKLTTADTGVITYHKGQSPIWTTHPVEKPFRESQPQSLPAALTTVIFQIGTSNPELAAQAAKVVEQDVSGIDLNCGCPKPFSTHSGMGAALLSTPDLLLDILRSLLRAVDIPVSCKIRLLPGQQDTRHLASRILRTGIRNLTVHCRTRDMRSGERAIWERLGDVVELGRRRGINVICNGDSEGSVNWEKIKAETGASSAMLARSAENNPSVFRPEGPLDNIAEVVPKLLNIAEYTKNTWGNTKFLVMKYNPSPPPLSTLSKQQRKDVSELISRGKTLEELADKLNIELGQGKAFFDELEAMLRARPEWGVWEASRAGTEEPKSEVKETEAEAPTPVAPTA